MIDITKIFPEDSFWSIFVCFLLYGILLIMSYNLRNSYKRSALMMWLMCVCFVEFAFWGGDYYHYADAIIDMRDSTFDYMAALNQTHMETPYWILAKYCGYNYLYFRFIIWGGSIFLLYLLCKFLSVKSAPFLYYFIPLALLSVSGSRLCISEVLALLGWYSFIKRWDEKGVSLLFLLNALFIIFLSTFLHKSSYFFAAILVLSVFDIDIKKLRVALISLPLLVVLISMIIIPFLTQQDVSEAGMINYRSAQSYLVKGVISYGIPTWISLILSFLANGLVGVFLYKSVKNGEYMRWPLIIRKTANVTLYVLLLSVPFLFQSSTYSMFYRFIVFMIVPAVFLLAMIKQKGYKYRLTGKIVVLYSISALYALGLAMLGKLV